MERSRVPSAHATASGGRAPCAARAASVPKPYILVGYSLGGRYIRLYTHQYPEDVMGLVLVDAYHQAFDTGLGKEHLRVFLRNRARQYRLLDAVARLGIARLLS
jgi:pimeloyl-ACP methyl ester carboxylesterase